MMHSNQISKSYITLIILVFIFLVFSLLLNVINKYNFKNTQQLKTFSLPKLYIDKNTLRRNDTHGRVILKGVSTMNFVYKDLLTDDLIFHLSATKFWNINLVGIFINPFTIEGRWAELDRTILWCKKNNMYVYLMPALNQRDLDHSLISQKEKLPMLIIKLTQRYQNQNNILFGLLAEPQYQSWQEWEPVAIKYIQSIRNQGNTSVIIISGSSFGRVIDSKAIDHFSDSQLMFNIHDYPFEDSKEAKKLQNIPPSGQLWDPIYKFVPIMLGEFGGVYYRDFGGEEDLAYIKYDLAVINQNNFHYTAYSIDDYSRIGEQAIINWKDGELTRRGTLFIEDFKNHPPTQFK